MSAPGRKRTWLGHLPTMLNDRILSHTLDFRLLRDLQCVVNLDAEIAYRAL
jgi:hypothetical protein